MQRWPHGTNALTLSAAQTAIAIISLPKRQLASQRAGHGRAISSHDHDLKEGKPPQEG
jgi:hypothetical protein